MSVKQINKLPVGKRVDPPTKQHVLALLRSETTGTALNKQQFLRVCQRQFVEVGKGVLTSVLLAFVVVPLIGLGVKHALLRGSTHFGIVQVQHLVPKVPDSVFSAVVSLLVARWRASGGLRSAAPRKLSPRVARLLALLLVQALVPVAVAVLHHHLAPRAAALRPMLSLAAARRAVRRPSLPPLPKLPPLPAIPDLGAVTVAARRVRSKLAAAAATVDAMVGLDKARK